MCTFCFRWEPIFMLRILPRSQRNIHFAFKVTTIRAGATVRLPVFSSAKLRHLARTTNAWLISGINLTPTQRRHVRKNRRVSMGQFQSGRPRNAL